MTDERPPRRRRRVLVLAAIAALAAALLFYVRCGSGWGFGGGAGLGAGGGTATPARARCTLKVTTGGIVVDGKPATRDGAVATCKAAGGAIVTVAGNAREGDWTELQRALEAAHVPIDRHGP
jgi:hypothetical protein